MRFYGRTHDKTNTFKLGKDGKMRV